MLSMSGLTFASEGTLDPEDVDKVTFSCFEWDSEKLELLPSPRTYGLHKLEDG